MFIQTLGNLQKMDIMWTRLGSRDVGFERGSPGYKSHLGLHNKRSRSRLLEFGARSARHTRGNPGLVGFVFGTPKVNSTTPSF